MLGEDNPHNNGATPDDHPGHPDNGGWSSSEAGRNAWRTVRSLGSGDNSPHRHQRRRAVEERAPSALTAGAGVDVASSSSARRDNPGIYVAGSEVLLWQPVIEFNKASTSVLPY
jgi:hypothetical protein